MTTTIEISDEAYEALRGFADSLGMPEAAVSELVEQALLQRVARPHLYHRSADELVGLFRGLRGTLRETSITDIVATRHQGLS